LLKNSFFLLETQITLTKSKGRIKMKNLTPLKAIRQNCISCCSGSTKEVKNCFIDTCTLFPYRMGKNPKRKGIGNKHIQKVQLKELKN
jgi:hypothetical protein